MNHLYARYHITKKNGLIMIIAMKIHTKGVMIMYNKEKKNLRAVTLLIKKIMVKNTAPTNPLAACVPMT